MKRSGKMVKRIFQLMILLLVGFLGSGRAQGAIELPATGQTNCYDSVDTVIPCVSTGQDGEILAGVAWPSPRFTDNGDGTATDNLTGIVWAKEAGAPSVGACAGGILTWQEAINYVACLNTNNYLGYSDWILPNINEMESLVDAEQWNIGVPALPEGHPFTNVQANYYWSSTNFAYLPFNSAWNIHMAYGDVSAYSRNYGAYVWPMRSVLAAGAVQLPKTGQTTSYASGDDGDLERGAAWPIPRFTSNGNGTVTDNLTGLMWTRKTCLSGDTTTWQQALDYVKGMNTGAYSNYGYTDWRLPNRKELQSLIDRTRYKPPLPAGHPFKNVKNLYYWISTTPNINSPLGPSAWAVDMYYGYSSDYPKSLFVPNYYYHACMWAVRDGGGVVSIQDLSVAVSDSPDPVPIGENLTYTATVANVGTLAATGVVLTDTLPVGVTFVSAASSQGSCGGTSIVTCNLGSLAPGTNSKVSIVVTPTVIGEISNTATAAGNEAESSLANNTATSVTTVYEPVAGGNCTGTGTYSLIGKIESQNGLLPDATVMLAGQGGCSSSALTDSAGDYVFSTLGGGTYTVTPAKTGCTFTPASRTLLINENSQAEFAAICQ